MPKAEAVGKPVFTTLSGRGLRLLFKYPNPFLQPLDCLRVLSVGSHELLGQVRETLDGDGQLVLLCICGIHLRHLQRSNPDPVARTTH